ncbi:unnamed protein product [Gongylonema pulchrum]|uniref:Colicin import membrane protein n=1 Tax=Gongylonema pulchrum TaxID=637853 RepID=A0A183ENY1_9BILA|nr:unnamed protein product [Gongylonema pulchrum]
MSAVEKEKQANEELRKREAAANADDNQLSTEQAEQANEELRKREAAANDDDNQLSTEQAEVNGTATNSKGAANIASSTASEGGIEEFEKSGIERKSTTTTDDRNATNNDTITVIDGDDGEANESVRKADATGDTEICTRDDDCDKKQVASSVAIP